MKQQYLYIFLIAAMTATIFTSCQKEEGTVTLSAEIKKNTNSKVYIDDHTPCWHNGDEVYINNAAYPIIAATGSSARIENVAAASAYHAIFPASIVAEGSDISSSSSIPITLPSIQHYKLVGNQQRVDVPMGAYLSNGNTLQFYNLCSIVRVIVSNSLNRELPLRSIELHAQTAKLSGAGTASIIEQSTYGITMSDNARNHVSLTFSNDCPASVDPLGTSTFDIVVPAFDIDDVTITVNTTDGQYFEVNKRKPLSNNTITTVTLDVNNLTEIIPAELVDGPTFNSHIPQYTTAIIFEYNSDVNSGTILSTNDSPAIIYGNQEGTVYRVSTSARMVNANPNCSSMFYYGGVVPGDGMNSSALETIAFGEGFNTSNVTNMSNMFGSCFRLTNLDLSSFNTSNVTNMSNMFGSCSILTNLDLSGFNTGNVTDMNNMFFVCSNLTSLNLSNFNTENVTDMSGMFSACYSLTSLDISSFNTANVTNMHYMFSGCSSLTSLNLSSFNTANVTDMYDMFSGCSSLTSLNLSYFNTSNVMSMAYMFYNCSSLTSLIISNFNTENVEYMKYMFYNCSSLTSLNLSNFNTSNVRDMAYMFYNCSSLANLNLAHFDMSSIWDIDPVENRSCKLDMCSGLSTTSQQCIITCPQVVESSIKEVNSNYNPTDPNSQYYITGLPTSGVTFTWQRP